MQVNSIYSNFNNLINFGIGKFQDKPFEKPQADLVHGFDYKKDCQDCDTFEITPKHDTENKEQGNKEE